MKINVDVSLDKQILLLPAAHCILVFLLFFIVGWALVDIGSGFLFGLIFFVFYAIRWMFFLRG